MRSGSSFLARAARVLVPCLLLLFVASCAPPAPPKPPVRELPPPAVALLSLAPPTYGRTEAFAFPDDQGSAAAQAAFAAAAGPGAVHEPALDLVAAVVGKTYAEEQELPARALLQWLYWKCGAVSSPGPVNVFVAPPGAEEYFQEHLRRLAAVVPAAKQPLRYGVARISVGPYVAQAVALGYRNVDMAPLPKSQPAGAKVPVRITLQRPHTDLSLYVDQGAAEVLKLPMNKLEDGSFTAEAPMPSAPGRYFIEVVGTQVPPAGTGDKGWRAELMWLPLYVGVAEPAAADEFIRHPPKNHPDRSAWVMQILSSYNDARARLGRGPLKPEIQASTLAQARSDQLASATALPPPDYGFMRKLAEAGLPSRNVHGYVDEIEFVSEYITLRLLRPAARHSLFDPAMTTIAVGISPRTAAPLGLWSSAEYVFETIRVDPPKERARLFGMLDAARGTPYSHNEPLSSAAQSVAEGVCKGGPKPTDARALFLKAQGLSPTLNNRLAAPWIGYDFTREDAAAIVAEAKDFTDLGVGVCQGTIDNTPGVILVMMLFAGTK
jgi:hypothetical protein